MDRSYLLPGDVLRLRSIQQQYVTPKDEKGKSIGLISSGHTAPKGRVFVAILIGDEPKDPNSIEQMLDVEAILNQMGWIRKPMPPIKKITKRRALAKS